MSTCSGINRGYIQPPLLFFFLRRVMPAAVAAVAAAPASLLSPHVPHSARGVWACHRVRPAPVRRHHTPAFFFACGMIHGAATAAGTMPLLPPLFAPATRSYRRSPRPGRRAPVRQPRRAGDADRECGACTVRRRRRRHDRSECHEIDRLQRGIARDTRTQLRFLWFCTKTQRRP